MGSSPPWSISISPYCARIKGSKGSGFEIRIRITVFGRIIDKNKLPDKKVKWIRINFSCWIRINIQIADPDS
jgi:hypothetical protein